MKLLANILKRYAYFLLCFFTLIIIYIFYPSTGIKSFESIKSSLMQMLSVLPPIMIMLGLIDVWVPRETLMSYMGEHSGVLGIIFSMLLGSIAAGPMYAAFPFALLLIKKGARFSNVIIFMNAWCVTKISTLLFEISALGYKFTIARLIINVPGIIIIGYLVARFINKDDIDYLTKSKDL